MLSQGCSKGESAGRWTAEEKALLRLLDRQAGGKRRRVLALAREALSRGEGGIKSQYSRLRLGKPRHAWLVAPLPMAASVAAAEAPASCPRCRGRWRLDRDEEAGAVLVCLACGHDVYLH